MLDFHTDSAESITPTATLLRRRTRRLPPAAPEGLAKRGAMASPAWLATAFDEVDYGMLFLADDNRILFGNRQALGELDASSPLTISDRRLRARTPRDTMLLDGAISAASQHGLRRLLTLGPTEDRRSVSIVPLGARTLEPNAPTALVMLGKRRVFEALAVEAFAQGNALTAAETKVLLALCHGKQPTEIAGDLGVAVSTVRCQINSIRMKTGASSIRDLACRVSMLPPLMGVLRGPAPAAL